MTRPAERDVTIRLHHLQVNTTEDDGGDEPYIWILGFKVDANTITVSLPLRVDVQVIPGSPMFPHVIGSRTVEAPATLEINERLGVRKIPLRPLFVPGVGWFAGLAGVIALLWDEDNFSPTTSDAGWQALKKSFGPALAAELGALLNEGRYDDELSRNNAGVVESPPPAVLPLAWRVERIGVAPVRTRVVKRITDNIKGGLKSTIKDALVNAAGLDELADPDDNLGTGAVVFLGDDVAQPRDFAMDDFKDDEANYRILGTATSELVHYSSITAITTSVARIFAESKSYQLEICFLSDATYWFTVWKVRTTTRVSLATSRGPAPTSVRWVVAGQVLNEGENLVSVMFDKPGPYRSGPQKELSAKYQGGPGQLICHVAGAILDVTYEGGLGIWHGPVSAVWAYDSDPTLFPGGAPLSAAELLNLGYSGETSLVIDGLEIVPDDAYLDALDNCKRVRDMVDGKRIPQVLGKWRIDPGDPPFDFEAYTDRVKILDSINQVAVKSIVVR